VSIKMISNYSKKICRCLYWCLINREHD